MAACRTNSSCRVRLRAPLGLAAACGIAAPAAAQLSEPFPAEFQLESLLPSRGGDGSLGFVLQSSRAGGGFTAVAPAGDVNGDGVGDAILGAKHSDLGGDRAGSTYVVFGRSDGAFPALFDLTALDGSDGFRLDGELGAWSGSSVDGAGDVNGDGIDDVIIGAPISFGAPSDTGRGFVIFGRAGGGFPPSMDLMSLDGSNGFRLEGPFDARDKLGSSVASAGDINGDGLSDVVVGAPHANSGGHSRAGQAYVVFGRGGGGFPAVIELETLDGSDGFRIDGLVRADYAGTAVATAGDIDGDGVDDLVIGVPGDADYYGYTYGLEPGAGYLIMGRAGGGFPASIDVASDSTILGYRDLAIGTSVAPAGDFNGDGRPDLLLGGPASYDLASPPLGFGENVVIFGRGAGEPFPRLLELSGLAPSDGVRMLGGYADRCGDTVASAGDVNGDGLDDVIIGAPAAPAAARFNGEGYVVYGSKEVAPTVSLLEDLNGEVGFRIVSDTYGGIFVSSAGDVNGDGRSDLLVGKSGDEVYVLYGRNASCYADCDGSGELDFFDFLCFQNLFAAGDPLADCDESGELDFFDFLCFQNAFAEGCV